MLALSRALAAARQSRRFRWSVSRGKLATAALGAVLVLGCDAPGGKIVGGPLDGPARPRLVLEHPGTGGWARVPLEDVDAPGPTPNSTPTPTSGEEEAFSLAADALLEDYLAYAAANNPALRAAFYRWRAAVERIGQATALPDPMVGYGYFLEDFTARRAMEQHVFELSQTFPWFGKLQLRGDAAALAADSAAQEYEAARLGLFLDVRRAHAELYQLGREIELMEANLQLLGQAEAIVRSRFRLGQAMHADLARVQVELGRMEDRLRQVSDMRRPATARFNMVLNRAADAPIALPREIRDDRLGGEPGELLAALLRDNPRLHALETDVERERTEARLAGREYYPDVTVSAMAAIRGEDPLLARISINLPIWREKYAAGVREANARRIATAYMRHDEVNRLSAELQEALYEHDDAQRRLELYGGTLIPKATESRQASLAGLQAGTTSFLELLDAERTLLEFQLAESRARADRAIALARLDALVGRPVPRSTVRVAPDTQSTPTEPAP
jgi:outer membrane protein, heavy metal efflux system